MVQGGLDHIGRARCLVPFWYSKLNYLARVHEEKWGGTCWGRSAGAL